MTATQVIKRVTWNETEPTPYGPYFKHCEQTFELQTSEDYEDRIIETVRKNGIITFSASYPAQSEYAIKRLQS